MQNIHQRVIDAPADTLGALLDRVATPDDRMWPSPAWSPLVLDTGLTVGSRGGHGPIRYQVAAYEPGRRVRFTFEPGRGLEGYHELLITAEAPNRCRVTHTLTATLAGRMTLLWPLMIRWMHEALIQDLLDNAERAATGRLSGRPARWSWWVRLLRRARRLPPAPTVDPAAPARPR